MLWAARIKVMNKLNELRNERENKSDMGNEMNSKNVRCEYPFRITLKCSMDALRYKTP